MQYKYTSRSLAGQPIATSMAYGVVQYDACSVELKPAFDVHSLSLSY